jgi:hypothetical protein
MKVLSANVQRVPQNTDEQASYVALFSGVGVSYLPAANAEQKAHDIALLLLLQLFEVLVGAHLCEMILANARNLRRLDSGRQERCGRRIRCRNRRL